MLIFTYPSLYEIDGTEERFGEGKWSMIQNRAGLWETERDAGTKLIHLVTSSIRL